jgi:hypothetical protein
VIYDAKTNKKRLATCTCAASHDAMAVQPLAALPAAVSHAALARPGVLPAVLRVAYVLCHLVAHYPAPTSHDSARVVFLVLLAGTTDFGAVLIRERLSELLVTTFVLGKDGIDTAH